jgi:hypothetical protein
LVGSFENQVEVKLGKESIADGLAERQDTDRLERYGG